MQSKQQLTTFNVGNKTIYLIYFIITLCCYGITVKNGPNFNDQFVLLPDAKAPKALKAIPDIFSTAYVASEEFSLGYRPLAQASFAIESALFGDKIGLSHLINVLLYFFFCIVLHQLLLRLFPKIGLPYLLLTILFFIVHSTHVEVVASLKNREEILCGIFYLLFCIFYIDLAENKRHWIISSSLLLFAFMLGYFSKPAIVNVFYFPLIYYIIHPTRKNLKLFFGTIIFVLAIYIRFNYIIDKNINASEYTQKIYENPRLAITHFGDLLGFLSNIFLRYLKLLILPFQLKWYYGYNEVKILPWYHLKTFTALILFFGLLFIGFKNLKKAPILFLGMALLYTNLFMYSSVLVPYSGIITERALFIPSICFSILFLCLYFKIAGFKLQDNFANISNQWTRLIPLFTILIIFGINSFSRCLDWKDVNTLLLRDIDKQKDSAHANYTVANIYFTQYLANKMSIEYKDKAIQYLKRSIEIDPTYLTAYNNLTVVYYSAGDYNNALLYAKLGLNLDPKDSRSIFHVANCYKALNEHTKEIEVYKKAYELDPSNSYYLTKIAEYYFKNKDFYSFCYYNDLIISRFPALTFPYEHYAAYSMIILEDAYKTADYFEKLIDMGKREENIKTYLLNFYESKHQTDKLEALKLKLGQF